MRFGSRTLLLCDKPLAWNCAPHVPVRNYEESKTIVLRIPAQAEAGVSGVELNTWATTTYLGDIV